MDLGPLRVLVCDLVQEAFGVSATVTVPMGNPIETTAIWITEPRDDAQPVGTDLMRRSPRRILAIPRTALPALPRGSLIVVADAHGGVAQSWRVDGFERVDPQFFRVIVVSG